MTIADSGDRRNREGFAWLRQRFIRRAGLVSRTTEFRRDIDQLRLEWNQAAPRYPIAPVATVDELFSSRAVHHGVRGFSPAGLLDDSAELRARGASYEDWRRLIDSVSNKYWPPQYFTVGSGPYFRPPFTFASACFFCSPLEVGEQASRFFADFRVEPQSFPYEPGFDDKHTISRLTGQVGFLIDVLREHLPDSYSPEQFRDLIQDSDNAGWRHASQYGPDYGWEREPSERWWYIRLSPGLSTTDLRDATGEIVDAMRRVYGERRIDQMVIELRGDNMSQQKIADLLGVGKDVVVEALKSRTSVENGE